MYVPNKGKSKIAVIQEYEYNVGVFSNSNYPLFSVHRVFVIKSKEHPDPLKKMLWGRGKGGEIFSDYKERFIKVGKPIKLEYSIEGAWSAHQEDELMLKAIDSYVDAL